MQQTGTPQKPYIHPLANIRHPGSWEEIGTICSGVPLWGVLLKSGHKLRPPGEQSLKSVQVGVPLFHNLCFRAKERETPIFLWQSFFPLAVIEGRRHVCSQNDVKLPCYASVWLFGPFLWGTNCAQLYTWYCHKGPHRSALDLSSPTAFLLRPKWNGRQWGVRISCPKSDTTPQPKVSVWHL